LGWTLSLVLSVNYYGIKGEYVSEETPSVERVKGDCHNEVLFGGARGLANCVRELRLENR
jgi:hypothetical protein